MKKTIAALVMVTMTLVGCSDKQVTEVNSQQEGTLEEVMVEFQTPTELAVNEEVALSVKVTQGDEAVDDADSVEFEVWESGMRDASEMIDGQLTEDGVYEAKYTFDHDGVYYMFAHTTARGLHVMPKQELTVGTPDMSKVMPDESDDSMSDMNHE
ncbi:YtkA-like protein [Psychrobacillus insolitus]|uniref:YtkA-like protein n=1 Tax=Psychrobacillus insolitus TaxID=1461 RepID=A0A2W7MH54_9BACI|nr:FixH family protein [Psychrobacillus insolitus]PZX04933.1 YtkA-like protein [Psychrobacillus insolitus]